MSITRLNALKVSILSLAIGLSTGQSLVAAEFEIEAEGKSAYVVLRSIADQAQKQLVLRVADKRLTADISAETAYSATRQVVTDAGFGMHYENDIFTILPSQPASASAPAAITPATKSASKAPSKVSARRLAEKFSLTLRDTPVQEAFEMLAKRGRINLLLAPDVVGDVSANLYDVDLQGAIDSVAKAAGLTVNRNKQSIFISNSSNVLTAALKVAPKQVEAFKIQYSDVSSVEGIMREYLSEDGSLTSLPKRRMVVVRDTPAVIRQLKSLLKEIDMQPRQILIEAKILEITLTDEETYGIDWQAKRGDGEFGTLSLAKRDTAGMFLNLIGTDLNAYLSALSSTGRVRTLSTPKLLVLEDQDAEVIVGDKLGFRVVSTNGNTTTESVEFLESGIILRVKASVDGQDRILLDVHPEVSNGSLIDGLPVQKTTEVTTNLLAESGQEIFIGGLLRRTRTDNQSGVPGVSKVPLIGALFKKSEDTGNRTETVVIIKPRIVENTRDELEPMAELLESDSWFYDTIPPISIVDGCINNTCRY